MTITDSNFDILDIDRLENPASPPDPNMRSEDVLAAARDLVPLLREHAVDTDASRRIPGVVYRAVQDAGLLHILKPKKFGGLELSEHDHAMVTMTLAQGCASTAWVFSILSSDNMAILAYPENVQEEIWGDDTYRTLAGNTNLNLKATAERVDGGYLLSGAWGFCSGSDFSEWLIFNAPVGEEKEGYMFLVPREEALTIDDWTPTGLRGTGSRTKSVENVFVPEHRAQLTKDTVFKLQERRKLHPTFDAMYAPWPSHGRFPFSSVAVGAALGAVRHFAQTGASNTRVANALGGEVRLIDQDYVATEFTDAAGDADVARLIVQSRSRLSAERSARHDVPTEHEIASEQRDNALAVRAALRSVNRIHALTGAKAGFPNHPVSRAKRDAEMAHAHVTLNWRQAAVRYLAAAVEG